jgi:hypothetical protein
MLEGFQVTQTLHVAATLHVFDHLRDGAKSSIEIASAVGAHEPSVLRPLRYLVTLGVLTDQGDSQFSTTPMGDLLRSNHPGSLRPLAMRFGTARRWRTYGELYASVVSGERTCERAFGEPFFVRLEHNKQDAAVFNQVMTSGIPVDLLDACDVCPFSTLVDVGGGQGAFLSAILERYPRARDLLYDLPAVVAQANVVENADRMTRLDTVAGDMLQSVPPGGDAYVLRRIVHDWSDDEAMRILRNCRQAMNGNGRVLLTEPVLAPAGLSASATTIDIMLLALVSGRERT